MQVRGLNFVLLALCLVAAAIDHVDAKSSCSDVRAVVKREGDLDVFVDDLVLIFNSSTMEEKRREPVHVRYPGVPRRIQIDAAFSPAANLKLIFLTSGKHYFVLNKAVGRVVSMAMPLTNIFKRSRSFSSGIDAASYGRGDNFYFKGCTMIIHRKSGRKTLTNLKKTRIPCNVQASWSDARGVIVANSEGAVSLLGKGQVSDTFCVYDEFKTTYNICNKCSSSSVVTS